LTITRKPRNRSQGSSICTKAVAGFLKPEVDARPKHVQGKFDSDEPTDHPLAVEQRNGITMVRVREIAALLHPSEE
jgi:hypothetical protein